MKMTTNIRRVVNKISSRMTQLNVLFEALTNSIHANATEIVCEFYSSQPVLNDETEAIIQEKIDEIKIIDNGDGFSEKNYKSFGDYMSDYKADLGCKGVGRFVFLKLFNDVKYTSYVEELNKKRDFVFSCDFESDNISDTDIEVTANKTVLNLKGVTKNNYNKDKKIDHRLDLDVNAIKDKVLNHLMHILYFYKRKGVDIKISFINPETKEEAFIVKDNILEFKEKEFIVKDYNNIEYNFNLLYFIENTKGKLNAYSCANQRSVCEFSEQGLNVTLPSNYSGYFLLESDYLNEHVDDDRNEFDIYPIKTDCFNQLSWEMINNELKIIISDIVKENIPNAVKLNQEKIKDIQDERPYLMNYIETSDLNVAGFIDKKQIIDKAKKRFDSAKDDLIKSAGKPEYTDKELQDAIQITQDELVSYIQNRVLVIGELKTMLEDKEKCEKVIHNLFMKQYTEDNYFVPEKNNLWLLDDRFTNYSYAASDKQIKKILQNINSESETDFDNDKPDLALFFSDNPQNKQNLKAVVVELKSFSDNNKSDRKKFEGIQQLLDYIEAFQSEEKIKEIWAFLVTDLDEQLEKRLRKNDYIPMFSTDRPIYQKHFETQKTFIYIIGAKTLILDAEARNKVFIDIINKQSKLNDFLK